MVTRNKKSNFTVIPGNAKQRLEDDIDALFRVPLSEFISDRKTLATRLKKEGRTDEAVRVSALAKPSISAWTVNQLYWRHREPFAQLMSSGQRFRQAQTSTKAGKLNDMRDALDARRDALKQLSDLAADLLGAAGHNASLDTIRRIATTLEAMSAYASLPEGMTTGRLTVDVDPPGFDSLASFTPAPKAAKRTVEATRSTERKPVPPPQKPASKSAADGNASRIKAARQEKLATAKASLQETRRTHAEARARVQRLGAALKKADAEAKEAEKRKHETERRYKEASAASAEATVRAQNLALEVERANRAFEEATAAVEKASKELEALFRG